MNVNVFFQNFLTVIALSCIHSNGHFNDVEAIEETYSRGCCHPVMYGAIKLNLFL